jgi:ABC-type transport system involved in cytochrome c biogenesis ATPase subunit
LTESLIREHTHRGGLVVAAAHQRLLDEDTATRRLELS